jgi:hypothetical protein
MAVEAARGDLSGKVHFDAFVQPNVLRLDVAMGQTREALEHPPIIHSGARPHKERARD